MINMYEHPIESLMTTAMNSIRDMVDVNTIIGEPVEAPGNIMIIPISKVGFGFASGGSEFNGETLNEYTKKDKEEQAQYRLPFGGGSGAGVSINPVAFLVINGENVKLLPVSHSSAIDKLLDYVPDLIERVNTMINKNMQLKTDQKNKKMEQEEIELKENEREKKEYLETIKQEIGDELKAKGRHSKKNKTRDEKTLKIEYGNDCNEILLEEDD